MTFPRSAAAQVVDTSGDRPTYSIVVADFTPPATPTDYLTIANPVGSGKVIRITNVRITADATAVGSYDIYGYKRTAANTGGTAVAVTAVPHDSQNPASVAVVSKYTANPAGLGTGAIIRGEQYALPAITTTGYPFTPLSWFDKPNNGQPLVLRAGELFALNGGGNALPAGAAFYPMIEWTEDLA